MEIIVYCRSKIKKNCIHAGGGNLKSLHVGQ